MDSFTGCTHDPLMFLNADKNDLDAFLMNTSPDMVSLTRDLHPNAWNSKLDNSLDLDSIEASGQLGDMNWFQESIFPTMTHLDNDDTSDGTNLVSVNPQSIFPIQIVQNDKTQNLMSSESANSAAMRLHANCSNLIDRPESEIHTQISAPPHIILPENQTICILSVATQDSPCGSPAKAQNFLITSSRDSPHKTQTYVLTTACPSGLALTPASPSLHAGGVGSKFIVLSPQKPRAAMTDKNGQVNMKSGSKLLSPSQASPILLGRLQNGIQSQQSYPSSVSAHSSNMQQQLQQSEPATVSSTTNTEERCYPKPAFSYSCLIALALKNSKSGSLPVSEIYSFMCENFPYFKTAPDGWKNSVRHNLSLNKCFAKVDNPKLSQGAKKGCLWALNPTKVSKMEDEISKWGKKDPVGLLCSMAYPENLEAIEKGQAGLHYTSKKSTNSASCMPVTMETTPTKQTLEKHQSNIEKMEICTPVKADHSPALSKSYSHQQNLTQSNKDHVSLRAELGDFNFPDIPLSFSNDALADIVLQSSVWDEDLDSSIDLICDSPSSHYLSSACSPQTVHSSPSNPSLLSYNSAGYTQGVVPLLCSSTLSSPIQQVTRSPASVRSNLFGASTPTRRTLYT